MASRKFLRAISKSPVSSAFFEGLCAASCTGPVKVRTSFFATACRTGDCTELLCAIAISPPRQQIASNRIGLVFIGATSVGHSTTIDSAGDSSVLFAAVAIRQECLWAYRQRGG